MRASFFSIFFFLFTVSGQEGDYHVMLKEYYKNTVPTMMPAELYKKMLNGEKVYLLDTRMKKEYDVSVIKGATHVGFLSFNAKKVEEISKNATIIVYCTIGARSETVGEKIKKLGYTNVYNLYGGLIHWVNGGYPIYNHSNSKTDDVHVYSKEWGKWLKKGTAVY